MKNSFNSISYLLLPYYFFLLSSIYCNTLGFRQLSTPYTKALRIDHPKRANSNTWLLKAHLKMVRYLICIPNIKSIVVNLVYWEKTLVLKWVKATEESSMSIMLNRNEFIQVSLILIRLNFTSWDGMRRSKAYWIPYCP